MAAEDRTDTRGVELLRAVAQAPWRFDLFQVLRRIECAFRDRPRLGEGARPSAEPVRLTQDTSLAFAPSALSALEWPAAGPPRLRIAVLGLLGPNGPLPMHISEYARDRLHNASDPTLSRFLDVFHHRILSLYYRAYADTQPSSSFDRPASDRFAKYAGAQFGMGMPALRERDDVPDRLRLFFAGALSSQGRNADGLAAMLQTYFGVPTRIQQFVGEWVDIPEASRWRVGGPGLGSPLGKRTAVGRRAWICQGKFRVVMGPVDAAALERFLPGGASLPRLASLVRGHVWDQLGWDLMLVLDGNAARPWRLGGQSRLGATCWLGSSPRHVVVKPPSARVRARTAGGSHSQEERSPSPPD